MPLTFETWIAGKKAAVRYGGEVEAARKLAANLTAENEALRAQCQPGIGALNCGDTKPKFCPLPHPLHLGLSAFGASAQRGHGPPCGVGCHAALVVAVENSRQVVLYAAAMNDILRSLEGDSDD